MCNDNNDSKRYLRLVTTVIALSLIPVQGSALEFNFTSKLGFSQPALEALDRAAAQWTSRISDPITVNIQTAFENFSNPSVIGTAGSITLISSPSFSNNLINQLKLDSATEADDAIVASLPNLGTLSFALPDSINFDGQLSGTKANFKALAIPGLDLDGMFGANDAVINFNTGFSFDYDNRDGVAAGQIDFEAVAAHEIGHALGFVSSVDTIDSLLSQNISETVAPTLLDLFRFGDSDNPSNAAEFATATRNLIPGEVAYFDDVMDEYLYSTGETQGDGRQASHWKDGLGIGLLDPTLAFGELSFLTEADFRALDLIGYDITAVPVPPALLLFASALVLLIRNERKALESE